MLFKKFAVHKKNKKLLLGKIPKSLIALRKTATNQSINRSINQSTNQSTIHVTGYSYFLHTKIPLKQEVTNDIVLYDLRECLNNVVFIMSL